MTCYDALTATGSGVILGTRILTFVVCPLMTEAQSLRAFWPAYAMGCLFIVVGLWEYWRRN